MDNAYLNYSVLMSVYHKERAEYLKLSIESMLNQTILTNDFVLVCDGTLTQELETVIAAYVNKLNIVRLPKNVGLGIALNEGLKHCKNELVARMDSDDISICNRCELQLKMFNDNDNLILCSGKILEFENDINLVSGTRDVPLTHSEICSFSRKRNPFNHPCIMLKKTAVEQAGGYLETYPLFEDYYLWIRLLKSGGNVANIEKPLLFMRTPAGMYKRRGGFSYAKNMLGFHWWMKKIGWSSIFDFCFGALPHAVVCVAPNFIRKIFYKIMHK